MGSLQVGYVRSVQQHQWDQESTSLLLCMHMSAHASKCHNYCVIIPCIALILDLHHYSTLEEGYVMK